MYLSLQNVFILAHLHNITLLYIFISNFNLVSSETWISTAPCLRPGSNQ